MNEKPKKGAGGAPKKTPPPITTTDNFKLDLTDELMATGSIRAQRSGPGPETGSFQSQREFMTEKERKKAEKEHKKRNKIKAGKNKRVFRLVWLAMVVILSLALSSYILDGAFDFLAAKRQENLVEITIPENVTQEQLTEIMHGAGAITRKDFFLLYCQLTAKNKMEYIRSGQHLVRTNMDYEELINSLMGVEDNRKVITLAFPEGTNAIGVAKVLAENGFGTEEEALDAMNTTKFDKIGIIAGITNSDKRYYKLEGYLFPDTYQVYDTDSIEDIYEKMITNARNKLNVIKKKIEASSMTVDEILTMASIIEREAADSSDMYKVSAVLHNRLTFGAEHDIFRLECDSTVYYPFWTADEAGSDHKSRYNTYEVEGLPYGPICNPGMDAIYAALQPSKEVSDALYFCHDKDGNAYYASNVYDHEYNLELAGLTD